VIIADTGAVLALLDSGDKHHAVLERIFLDDPEAWILPWAILPEIDYLAGTQLGAPARRAFLSDVAAGDYAVEWGAERDLERARAIDEQYHDLGLGLVDAVVLAVAERLRARAIATLDLRHFGAVTLRTKPQLIPRDSLTAGQPRTR
jgi:predicted nucleic acid-binding protein